MKILHLNDKIELSGGVEVYIEQLMELLPDYGIQPHWFGIYENEKDFCIKSYKNEIVTQTGLSSDQMIRVLEKFISSKEIHLIHVHSISNPKLLEACFELAPVVRSMHEPRIVCPGQGKFWRNSETACDRPFGLHCLYHIYSEGCSNRHPARVYAAMMNTYYEINKASHKYKSIIAMSEFMITLAERANIDPSVLRLNPYFTPMLEKEAIKKYEFGNQKRILFVGRLSETKGVHYFIQMGCDILKKRDDVVFDIVGDGHDSKKFKSMIPEEFKRQFIFHGWKKRDEVKQLFLDCYLLVFPSVYPEAFGISGIEAMMAAKPVVAFDVGGVKTWMKHGKTGYLTDAKDTEKMTSKVLELLENDQLYKGMCNEARDVALKEFSSNVHINKLIKIYSEVLN